MPKIRSDADIQVIEVLRARVETLAKKNLALEMESANRGIEITKMIQIFLIVERLLPEGPREEFRTVAVEYAERCDRDKSRKRRRVLEFQEAKQGDSSHGNAW